MPTYADAYHETIDRLEKDNVQLIPIDFEPFVTAANQLYDGPWITERYIAISELFEKSPEYHLARDPRHHRCR